MFSILKKPRKVKTIVEKQKVRNLPSAAFFIQPPINQRRKQRMVNWKESQSLMRKTVHLHRVASDEAITVLLEKKVLVLGFPWQRGIKNPGPIVIDPGCPIYLRKIKQHHFGPRKVSLHVRRQVF